MARRPCRLPMAPMMGTGSSGSVRMASGHWRTGSKCCSPLMTSLLVSKWRTRPPRLRWLHPEPCCLVVAHASLGLCHLRPRRTVGTGLKGQIVSALSHCICNGIIVNRQPMGIAVLAVGGMVAKAGMDSHDVGGVACAVVRVSYCTGPGMACSLFKD